MTRAFLSLDDDGDRLRGLVAAHFGNDRRLTGLTRLAGGSKKGVYRLRLDDGTGAILYLWADAENYWPPKRKPTAPDDPTEDASGFALFVAAHAALTGVGVRVPELLLLDGDGRHLGAPAVLVEDVGGDNLEVLLDRDPDAAAGPLARLGDAVRRMHTDVGSRYGKVGELDRAPQARRVEDIVVDTALRKLDAAAEMDRRIADARSFIGDHVLELREPISPRQEYPLLHSELGPDHVLVSAEGEPVLIDIEGLMRFDVEWEHAFLEIRFGERYPALRPVALDPFRLELYRYAEVLSLIEGPLRMATSDFPDRQWMLDLAEWNIAKALKPLGL